QGSWRGVYGSNGYSVVGDTTQYPTYAQVSVSGASTHVWDASSAETRDLQKATNPADRIAATYYSATSFTIDVNLTDAAQHQVGLYFLDWDTYLGGRQERVEVLDAGTGAVLDSRTVTSFTTGKYLVWNLGGHVQVRITNLVSGSNAVVSGLFF